MIDAEEQKGQTQEEREKEKEKMCEDREDGSSLHVGDKPDCILIPSKSQGSNVAFVKVRVALFVFFCGGTWN